MSAGPRQFLASAPRGFGDLLTRELLACGAAETHERSGSVRFSGELEVAYRACLYSRIANRVFLEIARFEAADTEHFYAGVRALDWRAHLGPGATLACDFSGRHPTLTHSHFGALKLKDGIVDALRDATGARPDVAPERPAVRVHAHAHGSQVTLAIDLSGESLHRRGYRADAGEAPLKENVAAGVLLRAHWPELAAEGAEFFDPLCGSGTLCVEAALIAADRAPGLTREYFGFLGWRGHDARLWERLRQEALSRAQAVTVRPGLIRGADRDAAAIRAATANGARAGVASWLAFASGALVDAAPAAAHAPGAPGLVCTNPPYGVRLEDRERARGVHRELGAVLRERFRGWQAAVLTDPGLGMELGLRAYRTHTVWNGALECRLLRVKVEAASERSPGTLGRGVAHLKDTPGARMFANRLAKNLKRLGGWARRSGVSCYRLYDADMPEYAFAIDWYRTVTPEADWLRVQEYAAPAEIEAEAVQRRRGEVLATLPDVTGVAAERIRLRTRRRTRRGEQYEKHSSEGQFHLVEEGGLTFQVNFDDYLDSGLFLDHRLTRAQLRAMADGKRFLNLFGYTGTASVYAAAGGARTTTTVDLSHTYLDWAARNLALNGLGGEAHRLLQADCREWLAGARASPDYELAFLDPPTFSNSKRMQGVLDVARDHPELIEQCMRLLTPAGVLVFSTNAQRFQLHPGVGERFAVRDVSRETLPEDFARNPRIHRCYEIRKRLIA
ncbi:MAG TPA: bifunctional 23S rRNA (guanine(2069)-N(7))-methyltransferase RlmK/23S rRNA (guanine(2445)-N(2))-methyltransferase RlmL [Steroidobacteraceae bacterium]|nr:bifunctional 23S rRNA (guanine(2069)-N(7))-methyltransferase RlmK/23S rRNA (guanine(2445)-N(2))-methyltransferase RlmL [Steroidobacteraceae bacterium]